MRVNRDNKNGCWIWVGSKDKDGYANLTVNNKTLRVHRLMYTLFYGDPGKLHVCHKCDTPSCINPDHLFASDNQGNVDDKVFKNRHAYGIYNAKSKLNDTSVREIRERFKNGESPIDLGEEYGVSRTNIYRIAARTLWKHIE